MSANDDMIQGYNDGFDRDAVSPGPNRSASYVHGWKNGRDDRLGTPRATAAELRAKGDEAMRLDALAGIL